MLYKLESLRGIFACIVILGHSPYLISSKELYFMPRIDLLVDFFFVLSGFIISLAYQDRILRGLSFKSYFILRFGRIFPLHFFTLILCLIFLGLVPLLSLEDGFIYEVSTDSFFSNLFLLHSLGIHDQLTWNFPSWSISVEFYTYILFFLAFLFLDKKRTTLFPASIFILSYYLLPLLGKESIGSYTYDFGIVRCLASFYFGVWIYRLKNKINLNITKQIQLLEVLSVGLLIFFYVIASEPSYLLDYLIIGVFGLIIFVFSESHNGFIGKLLHLNILKRLGSYSYSIYMMHSFVIFLMVVFTRDFVGKETSEFSGFMSTSINLLIILITVLISKYTYHYIEHFFRLKAKDYVKKSLIKI